jgi:hypothetical protein
LAYSPLPPPPIIISILKDMPLARAITTHI